MERYILKDASKCNVNFSYFEGENVATAEVEAVLSNISALNDCVVYGVEVRILFLLIYEVILYTRILLYAYF